MKAQREAQRAYFKGVSPVTHFVFVLAVLAVSFFVFYPAQAAPLVSDIQLMPSISSPTLKNGQTLKITVLAKSARPVKTAQATISDIKETLDLKLTSGDEKVGVWSVDWQGHSLKEQEYKITLIFTDAAGYSCTDTSLTFSDPTLGRTSSTGSLDITAGMRHIHSLSQSVYSYLTSSVIDPAAGYAYFGTSNETPAIIVKVDLSDFHISDFLVLNDGETNLTSAVIDTAAGYAYFGTGNTDPGLIIKVQLSDFTRVGALTLESSEEVLNSAVIDTTHGYAYFGTGLGQIIKVQLSDFSRVGVMDVEVASGFDAAVIDPAAGYAYFAANVSPTEVVKIQLSDFSIVGTLSFAEGENGIYSAVIDPSAGFAYFAYNNGIVKIQLSDFTRVGALNFGSSYAGGANPSAAVIDITNGYAYFSTNTAVSEIIKIQLSDFTRVKTFVAEADGDIYTAVIDTSNGFIYYGSYQAQGNAKVIKLSVDDFYVLNSLDISADCNPGGNISAAVIDTTNGFAYFGTNNINPGKIIKVQLSDFTKVATLTLNLGEYNLTSGVIDVTHGYAYFGGVSMVIKVQLSNFTEAGTLNLVNGESNLISGAIDTSNGYAYFGTDDEPGMVAKIQLSDFTEADALTLDVGEGWLASAVVDTVHGYAYFGTSYETTDKIVKIQLSDFTRVGALEVLADEWGDGVEWDLDSAVIDSSGTYAYFGVETTEGPPRIIKVQLSDFTRAAALDLADDFGSYPLAASIDSSGTYAYFGITDEGGLNHVAQIQLSNFTFKNRSYVTDYDMTYSFLNSSVMDSSGGFVYFVTDTGLIIKRDLSFPDTPTSTTSISTGNIGAAVIDPSGGYAYLGTTGSPARVVKIQLSDFTRKDSLVLNSGESNLISAVIDPSGGYAYFGTNTSPGKIIKVQLSDFTRVTALTLEAGESNLGAAVIDPSGGYAYFGTVTSPGIVVKIGLSGFTRVGALTLEGGENNLTSSVIDIANGFAYFGTSTSPGIVVKIGLSGFTRVGALSLQGDENILTSAVIDTTNGFAYFGTDTAPGKVIKIQLSDFTRIGALTLETNEDTLHAATIDITNGYAYFGTYRTGVSNVYNYIVKIQLSDFTRIGAYGISSGGNGSRATSFSSGLIDLENGYIYFAADNSYGTFSKIATSRYKNYMAGFKVSLSSTAADLFRFRFYSAAASGNLRLALYDSAKNLVWQSDLLTNTTAGDWITVETSEGTPTSLTNLEAGDYWLVFQTNATVTVPVLYIGGADPNGGFEYPFTFASFPSSLNIASSYYHNYSWSFYAVYDPALITESDSNTVVREGGETDTYTVVLQSQPTSDVVITPTPDDQVTVSPASLTFTSSNWDTPQTVTVTAVDDLDVENVHAGTITHTVTSTDGTYNGAPVDDVTVVILDNDGGAHYTSGFTAPLPDFNLFPPLLAKTTLTTSAADWTIKSLSTNEVGHKLYDADKQVKATYIKGTDYTSGGSFIIKSDSFDAPNTLLPAWTIVAYDSAGKESSSLTLGNVYTLAAAPAKINADPSVPIQIINLKIDGGKNPASTEYAVRVDGSNQKWVDQDGGFQSSPVWLPQTSWTVKKAVLGEAHTYAARARNGNGVVTDFSTVLSATAYKGAVLAINKTGTPPSTTISVLNTLSTGSGGAGAATASLFLFSSLIALSMGRSRPKNAFSLFGGFFHILRRRPADSFAHFVAHGPENGACPISFSKYKRYAKCARKSFVATLAMLALKGGLLAVLLFFAYASRADVAMMANVTPGSLMDCTIKVKNIGDLPAENVKISDEMDSLTELQGKIQVGAGSLTQDGNKFESVIPYKLYPGSVEPIMYRIKISSEAPVNTVLKNTATAVADNASSVSSVLNMLVVNSIKTPQMKKQEKTEEKVKKKEEVKQEETKKAEETQKTKPAEEKAPAQENLLPQKTEAAKTTKVNAAKPLYIAPVALETSPAAVDSQKPLAQKSATNVKASRKLSLHISGAATSLPSGEIYTNNVSPAINGQILDASIPVGSVVKAEINGQEVCQTVLENTVNKTFTCIPQVQLSDGIYQVVISVDDYSQTQTLVIDTQAPAAPPAPTLKSQSVNPVQMAGLMGIGESVNEDAGSLTVGEGRVAARLSFSGYIADADWQAGVKQARLVISSNPIVKDINLNSQDWNYDADVVIEPGNHQATLALVDLAGNVSVPSEPMQFIVGEPSAFVKNVVAPVAQTVDKTVKAVTAGTDAILAKPAVKAVTQNVEKVIDNPQVEKVNENYAAPAVAVATAATTAGAINFASLLNLLQALFTQPILLLERRRRKGWGVVYDSLTKLPVDLAMVRLFSAQTGKLLQTRVTDRSGRYAFIVEKGLYRLEVSSPNYQCPSQYLKDKNQDVDYLDIYHGGTFNITDDSSTIALNIPIDRKEEVKTPKAVIKRSRFRALQSLAAFTGPLFAFISFTISQTALIFAFVVLQVVLYLLFKRLSYARRPKSWGVVYDKQTKRPIKYALVRIFEQNYNKLLDTQVTDAKGRYSFLVGRNVYYLTFDKQGYVSQRTGNLDTMSQQKEAVLGVDVGLEKIVV